MKKERKYIEKCDKYKGEYNDRKYWECYIEL